MHKQITFNTDKQHPGEDDDVDYEMEGYICSEDDASQKNLKVLDEKIASKYSDHSVHSQVKPTNISKHSDNKSNDEHNKSIPKSEPKHEDYTKHSPYNYKQEQNLELKNTYSDKVTTNNKQTTLKNIFTKTDKELKENLERNQSQMPPTKPYQPVIGQNISFEKDKSNEEISQAQFQNNFLNSKYNNKNDDNPTGIGYAQEEMNQKQRMLDEQENYFINKGDYTPKLLIFTRLQERKTNDFCVYGFTVIYHILIRLDY